MFVCIIAEYVV